ncbi:xanthine dehydrogenase family protein molybdopterin-binding subunit [Rhodovibrio salinarum]|nr:xanthine dehydrogenase family protein molybdopterin-binding subunit [Rhodovibrio salinarum]
MSDTHTMQARTGTSRRTFLKQAGTAAAGLVVGVYLPTPGRAASGAASVIQGDGTSTAAAPNAFVRIAPDDTVTVLSKHSELGQGPYTGLTTLVAEELDADWSQMRATAAPSDPEVYKNLDFGLQGTGGSNAIKNSYTQMRRAGAAARAMLVAAAAETWDVPADEITVRQGRIRHEASGQEAGFGAFAAAAAEQPAPKEPKLKSPDQFRLIGTDVPKVDSRIKATGEAQFTLDLQPEGTVTVLVAHPPRFGSKVTSFDDSEARKIKGVLDVKQVPYGIAVYATGFWPAKKGRDSLEISWDDSNAETRSSEEIIADHRKRAQSRGKPAADRGQIDDALAGAEQVLEAEFIFPYLAHAPMEPLDALVTLHDDGAEARFGSQLQTVDHKMIAQTLGLPMEKVQIHTMLAGGSFGRRGQQNGEFAAEAAAVAKAWGETDRPIKLVYSREDDITGGRYRPIYVHKLKGGLDADGNIVAWDQSIVGQSIIAGSPFSGMMQDGIDPTSVEGARNLPYAVPNLHVSLQSTDVGVPPLWWRSVGHTHTGFATEVFLDELLAAAGRDQVEGRLALLGDHPRHAGVLKAVARMADWDAGPPEGRARGVAVHKSFDTYVAQIAEVSQGEDGLPKVHRVWCAVDCGVAVNPNVVRAQMEGGIGYGLGAVLYDEVELKDGKPQQNNFDGYRSLRMDEMPAVEVEVVQSDAEPTGVGEPGTPPIGPAVAIAFHRLTGQRVRRLPFVKSVQT